MKKDFKRTSTESSTPRRVSKLEKALKATLRDLKEGNFVIESVEEHIKRVKPR